jgi:negative regulator of flagellin synthesis FlgM
MRIFGSISELVDLAFRLAGGKQVKVRANVQTTSGNLITVNVPDVAATGDTQNMLLTAATQTMTNNVARSGTYVFDATKVQAMRTAIQNGSFSVNAEAIADKMLANAREMMSVASAGPTNTAGNNPSM